MNWTNKDLDQFKSKNIDKQQVEQQISHFVNGFPFMDITEAAIFGKGLIKLDEEQKEKYIRKYNYESTKRKVVKFVPASGAASRMFKALFELKSTNPDSNDFLSIIQEKSFNSPANFFNNIDKFPFLKDIQSTALLKGHDIETLIENKKFHIILDALLEADGLNYGGKPKGLLKFHGYTDDSGSPTREHLVEGALYASGSDDIYLHFTVSPEHLDDFKNHVEQLKPSLEKRFGVKYYIGFSIQKPSTDTIAVDENNKPFRNDDGSILFRPGGHGALIENLNELSADIIFIKNIDNVVPDRIKTETVNYKKALAGVLIEYQQRIFSYLNSLNANVNTEKELIDEIKSYLENELCFKTNAKFSQLDISAQKIYLIEKLNRPIRVCGMVKNEGEPGGGPFWAQNSDRSKSLHIVESSQIDLNDSIKKGIIEQATHFNPVDLICGIKDFKGQKFNLTKYVDPDTGFISRKSKNGKELKAMELPGLWNGAMSNWITLFVEVPIITFNPVKVINDLLRPEHQNEK